MISETGVDSRYCGSRLSDAGEGGLYILDFPMPEENNGNGTVAPGLALPGTTPWRTITVGDNLKPIVETTVIWDVVEPLYETVHDYRFGRGTWSWILWQDGSINYEDQVRYIDLAAAMGYEYVLIDNWWDRTIGREKMKSLADYAHRKGVDIFLWYSSSGYWNDIVQSPVNCMDNPIVRKREMRWLESLGVKGIKVDFFGGDKQETMRLYEAILSEEGESAELYYNLGNSYYKNKNVAKAVLNYERALLLDPGNADARFNLEMARSKTTDKVTPVSEVFIVTWAKAVVNWQSESQWGVWGIVSFILLLASLGMYIFGKQIVLKKIGFTGAVAFLMITICANLCASQQKDELITRDGAIIMSPSITVKSTPNENGTNLFVLHEGAKVYIDDNSMKAWKEIRLEDGKKGWVPTSSIEII